MIKFRNKQHKITKGLAHSLQAVIVEQLDGIYGDEWVFFVNNPNLNFMRKKDTYPSELLTLIFDHIGVEIWVDIDGDYDLDDIVIEFSDPEFFEKLESYIDEAIEYKELTPSSPQ